MLQEGVGLDAINDAFLLESSVYRLLKKYCGERPYYLHLLELFLQVSLGAADLPRFWAVSGCIWISDCPGHPTRRAPSLRTRRGAETALGFGVLLVLWGFSRGCVNKPFLYPQTAYQTELGQMLDLLTAPISQVDLNRFSEQR